MRYAASRMSKIRAHCLAEIIIDAFQRWLPYSRFPKEPAFSFFMLERENWNGWYTMARKAARNRAALSTRVSPGETGIEWANCQLDDEDVAAILESANDLSSLGDSFAALLSGNGDITIRRDAEKSEYSAFVTSPPRQDTGVRIGISARAQTGLLAAAAVFYKVSLYKSRPDRFTKSGQNLGIR